jgi:hypothetical protein
MHYEEEVVWHVGCSLLDKLGTPFDSTPMNQQGIECGWPRVNVGGGANPPKVSPLSE